VTMNDPAVRLAGCVIRNELGEILLLHRNKKGIQQWELPGGKLEEDEAAEQAAMREILEELGVEVAISAFLGRADFYEKERQHSYEWYEAVVSSPDAAPTICEPHSFDDLKYWDVKELHSRSDTSANLKNLLASGVL
jgi:mutator protein MutT